MVDDAVCLRLLRTEPAVALAVAGDLLDGLSRVLGLQLVDPTLDRLEVGGLDLDVGGRPLDARGRLVHHDPRVGQGEALAGRARAEDELAHRGRESHCESGDVVGDEPHRVVDGQARGDGAAGTVDVEADVGARVAGREQEQLGRDPVGDRVVDLGPEDDDPLVQQLHRQLVVQRRGREWFGHAPSVARPPSHGSPALPRADSPTAYAALPISVGARRPRAPRWAAWPERSIPTCGSTPRTTRGRRESLLGDERTTLLDYLVNYRLTL